MMKNRIRQGLLIALDTAMIGMEWPVVMDALRSSGTEVLRYYTQDSNIFAMILCAISLVGTVVALLKGRERRPAWAKALHHVAASCLMVTFLVSAFVLVPSQCGGTWASYVSEFRSFMLEGPLLYMHTLCPLVMLGGFLILEEPTRLTVKNALWALVPTLVYGLVTLYMNFERVYSGPYFFFRVYRQPLYMTAVWMIVILTGAFLVSEALVLLSRLKREKT